ncbi:MAG: tetratricopeptide repeat protein [Candidatus Marinimicrobia bacterium]|nr:tetratricopeptide repeat protein [Candidatus Neomarinimicrobiota bacterium]
MSNSSNSPISDNIFLSSFKPPLWLFLFGFTLYLQTLNYGFSPLDDNYLYLDKLRWFMNIGNLPELFVTSIAGFYRPVLFMTFFPDAIFGSGSALPFHLTNLCLHVASSILLYYFLQQLNITKFVAFCMSLLFIAHPINIQTVAWIPGRNDMLLAILTMSAFIFFFKYLKTQNYIFFIAHLLTYLFALLTKENAIVIPFLVIGLINFTKLSSQAKIQKSIYVIWGVLTGVWFFFQRSLVNEYAVTDFSHLPTSFYHFISAWIFNSGKLIFPVYQAILPTSSDTPVLPFLIMVIVFIMVVLYLGLSNKRLFYFGLFWCGTFLLIPTIWSSIDKIGEYYEHRLYLPLIGFLIMVSSISLQKIPVKLRTLLPLSLLFIVLFAFSYKIDRRSHLYVDKLTFAEACVKESPNHARSYKLLGTALSELGRHSEAIQNFDISIEMYPKDEDTYYNRGSSYFILGNFSEAIQDYSRAIQIKPVHFAAYNNRGIVYGNMGEIEKAESDFNFVISQDPTNDKAYNNKGLNYYRIGKLPEALDCFSNAIKFNDNLEYAFNNRGQIYLDLDQLELAINDFNQAIQLNFSYLSPFIGRAKVYKKLKLDDLAQKDIDYIKQLQPDLSLDVFFGPDDKIKE